MFDRELFLAKRAKVSKLTVKVDGYSVSLIGRPKTADDAGIVKLAASQAEIDEKGKGGVSVSHRYTTVKGKEANQRDVLTPADGALFLGDEAPPEEGNGRRRTKAEERAAAEPASVNGTAAS